MKLHLRIIALFMAFLVIFSTAGLAVSKHFCGDVLKTVAINHEATPCVHQALQVTVDCPVHGKIVIPIKIIEKDCCHETNQLIKNDIPQSISFSTLLTDIQPVFVFTLVTLFNYETVIQNHTKSFSIFEGLAPPLINKSIAVLFQSFLL